MAQTEINKFDLINGALQVITNYKLVFNVDVDDFDLCTNVITFIPENRTIINLRAGIILKLYKISVCRAASRSPSKRSSLAPAFFNSIENISFNFTKFVSLDQQVIIQCAKCLTKMEYPIPQMGIH